MIGMFPATRDSIPACTGIRRLRAAPQALHQHVGQGGAADLLDLVAHPEHGMTHPQDAGQIHRRGR